MLIRNVLLLSLMSCVLAACGRNDAVSGITDSPQGSYASCSANVRDNVDADSWQVTFYPVQGRNENFIYSRGMYGEQYEVSQGGGKAGAGQTLRVTYGGILVPQFLADSSARMILGYKLNGADFQSVMQPVSGWEGGRDARFSLPPDTRELELWFELHKSDGAVVYDSQGGRNYRVEVVQPASVELCFDRWWNHGASRRLRAGDTLRLNYDTWRLLNFLQGTTYNGYPTYSLFAYVRFTDQSGAVLGGVRELPLQVSTWTSTSHSRLGYRPLVKIPVGTSRAEIWFKGSGRAMPHYDSNLGANYVFAVDP